MKNYVYSALIVVLAGFICTACDLLPIVKKTPPLSEDSIEPTTPPTLTPTPTILPANTFGIVDNSTLYGKMVVGYQGWFGCPGDGSAYNDWIHWFQFDGIPTNGKLSVDFWPDVSELSEEELCRTQMTDAQGNTMYSFSSYNPLTVSRHFKWMAEYGIDGVELERFVNVFVNNERRLHQDQVLKNVRDGAEEYGRVFYIQYDGIQKDNMHKIKQDWVFIRDTFHIQNSPSYLHHNGLPVVGIFGIGFKNRDVTPEQALDLIDFFQNHPDPKYRATVLGGVPSYWRTLSVDSQPDSAWADVYRSFDIINPWHVASIYDQSGADIFFQNVIIPDLEETRALGIDYMPVIFPGFSWNNIMHDGYNKTPRDGGNFFWKLAYNVISQDVKMILVAMFDEVDEGTAIFKLVTTPDQLPSGRFLIPLNVDGYNLPSDWYLILAGRIAQMLRGEIPLSTDIDDLPEIEAETSDTSSPEPPPAPPDKSISPFEVAVGNWEGIDLDGSIVTMKITKISEVEYSLEYHDDGATCCGTDANGKIIPADGFATGTTSTDTLFVKLEIICLTTPQGSCGVFDLEFPYDSSTDTITDSIGVLWYRSK